MARKKKEQVRKARGPNPNDFADYGDFMRAKREAEAKKGKK